MLGFKLLSTVPTPSVRKKPNSACFHVFSSSKRFNLSCVPNGIILWHDYVPGKRSSSDVVKYINSILDKKKIYKIKNTSLCFYKNC